MSVRELRWSAITAWLVLAVVTGLKAADKIAQAGWPAGVVGGLLCAGACYFAWLSSRPVKPRPSEAAQVER
jgi:cytosine/uracil/thiamine/allantoin permease